jgi:hypothetical protein
MAIYRCKFLSLEGKVETVETFECGMDYAAHGLCGTIARSRATYGKKFSYRRSVAGGTACLP